MKHCISIVLILLVATFAAGQEIPSAGTAEPFALALNEILGIKLGMNQDALPKSTPDRELRCALADNHNHVQCKLLIHDEVIVAGARVLFVNFVLDMKAVTNIAFDLDTSHMGLNPLVFSLRRQLGEQFGKTRLPLLCWQNQVSSLILFAAEDPPAVVMSIAPACDKYDEPLSSN